MVSQSIPAPAHKHYMLYLQRASAPAKTPVQPVWHMLWSTEAEDHEREPVVALAHAETFEGLPGGSGHAGWLVSSSRGCLNLWECFPGSGSGDPALMVRSKSDCPSPQASSSP